MLTKWFQVVVHFVDKFQTVAQLLGPSSILALLRSYELKEQTVRSAMSQMRMDATRRGKLKLEVNRKRASRDGNKSILLQLLDCIDTYEQKRFDDSSKLTPLAVNEIVVKFTGELGEGTALVLACFMDAAQELRSNGLLFESFEQQMMPLQLTEVSSLHCTGCS